MPSQVTAARKNKLSESPFMTVAEFMEVMGIARSTFDEWRAKEKGPKWWPLPNGSLRCRRTAFEQWITELEEAAA